MVLKLFVLVVAGDRTDEPPTVVPLPFSTTLREASHEAWAVHLGGELEAGDSLEDGLGEAGDWSENGLGAFRTDDGRFAHVVELVY